MFTTEPMNLTTEQVKDLCQAHCYRVIDQMNHDDLISYAVQMMYMSFEKNPGVGDIDVEMLISDIYVAEDEDDDSVREFISGTVGDEIAEQVINYQFWTMDTYDFVELEAEVYDWQDDMLIPADDDAEAQQHFVAFINSNYDYWLLCLQQF